MRYYDISITDPKSGKVVTLGTTPGVKDMHFTSFIEGKLGGVSNPGALNIEMDIPVVNLNSPSGSDNAFLKIWGMDLGTLNKVSALNQKNITIKAGMKKGLPLATAQVQAKPTRNGIIFEGSILQALTNWQGIEQTLEIMLFPQTEQKVYSLVFNCAKEQTLQSAIEKTFADAGLKVAVQISPNLVASKLIAFNTENINSLSVQLYTISKSIIKDTNYKGIQIVRESDGYLVTDYTVTTQSAIDILFTDMIGQPTWLNFNLVSLKLVMRSDIKVGDIVNFPKDSNFLSKRMFSPKDGIEYTGYAQVDSVRHIGNFRQPDANSWVTVVNVIPLKK